MTNNERQSPPSPILPSLPPPPPDDLRSRCAATIPVGRPAPSVLPEEARLRARRRAFSYPLTERIEAAVTRERYRRRKVRFGLAALACLVGGVCVLRPFSPSDRANHFLGGDAAFADTIRAMQRVTFFHMHETGVSSTWTARTSQYTGDWWFDAKGGFCDDSYDTAPVQQYHTLYLPNGQRYYRYNDRVRVFSDGPERWDKTRRGTLHRLTDLSRLGSGVYVAKNLKPNATQSATWNGRPATHFTFVAAPVDPEGHDAPKDMPTIRSEVYVDPNSHRVIAVQKYARYADHPEAGETPLSLEEYDYTQRPDSAHFDPRQLLRGAKTIERAKGTDDAATRPEPDE